MNNFKISGDDSIHKGEIDSEIICEFEYRQDEAGSWWLSSACTKEEHQKKGYGTKMIQYAVELFGGVYFSMGSQYEHSKDDSDTRYLSIEGAALANSCLKKGIIKNEWYYNPFEEDYLN